jgi:hypothetical protein
VNEKFTKHSTEREREEYSLPRNFRWGAGFIGHASAMLDVLMHARSLLIRDGWARGQFQVDSSGSPAVRSDGDSWTLSEALNDSPVTADRWEVRILLQRIAGNPSLPDWNAHPYREGADVVALIDKAIRLLGGEPPRVHYRSPAPARRRGPHVSNTREGKYRP